jgi:hypothetical protein
MLRFLDKGTKVPGRRAAVTEHKVSGVREAKGRNKMGALCERKELERWISGKRGDI